MTINGKPKFTLGQIVATPGALAALRESGQSPQFFLSKHVRGDWGDVCAGDPAIDLSIAFGALAGPARAAFLAAHGALDAATELRARAIALTLATTLLAYALDQRLSHVESECRRALAAAVS